MGWDNNGFIVHYRPDGAIPVLELSTDLAAEQDRALIALFSGESCVAEVKLREFVLGLMESIPDISTLQFMRQVNRGGVRVELDLVELIASLRTSQRVQLLLSLNQQTTIIPAVVQIMANLPAKEVSEILQCLSWRPQGYLQGIVAEMPEPQYRAMLMQADRGLLDQLTTIFDAEGNA